MFLKMGVDIFDKLEQRKRKAVQDGLSELFTDWEIKIIFKFISKKDLTQSERTAMAKIIRKKARAIQVLRDLADIVLR